MIDVTELKRLKLTGYAVYGILAILAIAYVVLDYRYLISSPERPRHHVLIIDGPIFVFIPLIVGAARFYQSFSKWKNNQPELLRLALPFSFFQGLSMAIIGLNGLPAPFDKFVMMGIWFVLLGLGYLVSRLPMNKEIGIVCGYTLSSLRLWKETHRFYFLISILFCTVGVWIAFSSNPFYSVLLVFPLLASPYLFAWLRFKQMKSATLATSKPAI